MLSDLAVSQVVLPEDLEIPCSQGSCRLSMDSDPGRAAWLNN